MRNPIGTTLAVTATVLGVLACAWLAVKAAPAILILLVSAIVASAVGPLGDRIAGIPFGRAGRRTLPRGLALVIAYVLVLGVIGSAVAYYVYVIGEEAQRLVIDIPTLLRRVTASLAHLRELYPSLPSPESIIGQASSDETVARMYAARIYSATVGAVGIVWSSVTVMILSFYMALESEQLRDIFLGLVPERHRATISRGLQLIGLQFGRYVRGQLLIATIMGVTATIGAAAIGLRFPFLIGAAVGLADCIPLVGAVVGAIPATLIALTQERWQLVAILVFFFVIQQIENNVLIPKIMSRAVRISPVVTLAALLIGGAAFGIAGALIAIPFAAALQVAIPTLIGMLREDAGDETQA